ncbi:MAG: hypothetical protein SFU91_08885 [Chloroherpetonaceae bacterium]|nr:hypothetical protein [Chloroherpetonaceae bacterium]
MTLGVSLIFAQPTPEEIKSGGYKWGESKRENETEASNAAKADLIQRIVQTVINSDETVVSQEVRGNEAKYESYVKSRSKVASRMQLRGLNVIQLGMEGNSYKALAYISNEDYNSSLKAIENEVIAEFQTGEQIERSRGIANAIPVYYKAFLKTYFSPDLISFDSPSTGPQKNFQTWIYENKLLPFLREIKVTAISPTPLDVDVTSDITSVQFEVKYRGAECQGITLWKMPRRRSNEVSVLNGKAKLEFSIPELKYQPPYHTLIKYELGYKVALEEGAPSELKEAQKIAREIIIEPIEVTVDYSKIVEFDLAIRKVSSTDFVFDIVMKNFISQSPINISYGDNTSETLSKRNTIYTYRAPGKYLVTLEVKPLPVIKKYLSVPSGEIIDVPVEIPKPPVVIPTPEPKPEPKPSPTPSTPNIGYKPNISNETPPLKPTETVSAPSIPSTVRELPQPPKPSNKDVERKSTVVEELKTKLNAQELLDALSKLKNQGKLFFGKKTDFLSPEKCTVFLIDRQSKTVKFILGAGEERTLNLISNTPVKSEELKNLTAIWVEIY